MASAFAKHDMNGPLIERVASRRLLRQPLRFSVNVERIPILTEMENARVYCDTAGNIPITPRISIASPLRSRPRIIAHASKNMEIMPQIRQTVLVDVKAATF